MIALLLTTLALGASITPQDPGATALRASRAYRSLTSLRATFHQVIEDRMIGTQESRGELVQAGSAELVMRFTDPAGDMIVLDGQYVWLYTPSTVPGQVIRMAIPHDPVYGPNVLSRILDRPTERYEVTAVGTESLDGQTVDVLRFTPLSPDPLFATAIIAFDRQTALPRRLILDELTGIRRTLTLTRLRPNGPVRSGEFTFAVPAGVRVVDR